MGKEFLKVLYWNKGSSRLINKRQEIEVIAHDYSPHVIGIAEANLRKEDHHTQYQIQGYNIEKGPLMTTGDISRVVVYIKTGIDYYRRTDLEDGEISTIWVILKVNRTRSINLGIGYRQWKILGAGPISATKQSQIQRFRKFLDKWAQSLMENKETLMIFDANFD